MNIGFASYEYGIVSAFLGNNKMTVKEESEEDANNPSDQFRLRMGELERKPMFLKEPKNNYEYDVVIKL